MDITFEAGDVTLVGSLTRPTGMRTRRPGVVIAHGFPSVPGGASFATQPLIPLGERITSTLGWSVLTFPFRGCGQSGGNFSLEGWLVDLLAAVERLHTEPLVEAVWLAGFGTGGALSICAAAEDPRVVGVATLGAPAGFEDWASHPRRLLEFARETEVIRQSKFPASFERWASGLRRVRPLSCIGDIRDRPLMAIHGTEDTSVPLLDARELVDEHGAAEFRYISGASHDLRIDPRAIAVLLGWLDRQWTRRHATGRPNPPHPVAQPSSAPADAVPSPPAEHPPPVLPPPTLL